MFANPVAAIGNNSNSLSSHPLPAPPPPNVPVFCPTNVRRISFRIIYLFFGFYFISAFCWRINHCRELFQRFNAKQLQLHSLEHRARSKRERERWKKEREKVCVCVREREREREWKRGRQGEKERVRRWERDLLVPCMVLEGPKAMKVKWAPDCITNFGKEWKPQKVNKWQRKSVATWYEEKNLCSLSFKSVVRPEHEMSWQASSWYFLNDHQHHQPSV